MRKSSSIGHRPTSRCAVPRYHLNKLQCQAKKQRTFYETYAPRSRVEEYETQSLPSQIVTPLSHKRDALVILVSCVLALLVLGILFAPFLFF